MALSPAAAALSKNATRIGANISKRLTRLTTKDVKGGAILIERMEAELEAIRQMPVTNYHEARSKEARMRRLDKAAGTRADTFQKAAKRAYNDDLLAQTNDPFNVSRMSKEQLAEVFSIQRSRLRGKVRRVKESIDGGNFMTNRVEELLKEDPKTASHNKLRSFVSKAAADLKSKTLTVTGAKKQFEDGVKLFGDAYKTMDDKQRYAVWEAMHRQMELLGLSSERASDLINGVVNDQKFLATFLTSPTGDLQAVLGQSLNSVEANKHKRQLENETAKEIFRNALKKRGKEIPAFLQEYEDDQPTPF